LPLAFFVRIIARIYKEISGVNYLGLSKPGYACLQQLMGKQPSELFSAYAALGPSNELPGIAVLNVAAISYRY